ncbi:uncharacterized protein LOC134197867 isoform X2 [Corticium candelabrum]|uniref:uncharacterized protein LOC134197867 isoform X2 n=1 Tax=Corticium candelabrum TaxID=121492 RepID=UPI002E25DF56|nr:uncharacterized protein LOC134197867 isoform X2 [Corticium candelabrum]
MLYKHLNFHLFVFRVSIVVAFLESVASEQTVLCPTDDSKGLPTISEQSTVILSESNSRVKACFNVTGSPKPSLKIDQQANKIVDSSVEIADNCVYFVPENVKNAETIIVAAENCFGQSYATINVSKFQSTLDSQTIKSHTPHVSNANANGTLKPSESSPVSSYLISATTQSTIEVKNKTSSGFPIWASAIIAIFSIAALILVVFLIIRYVRKKRLSRAASQESKDDDLMDSEPTVYAIPMKKRAVVSPFIKESAAVTAEQQPSMILANQNALDSSSTNQTETLLYSNLSQAETNTASQGVKLDESELLCEEDAQAMYATPVKTTTPNSQPEIEHDNTLTVTQQSSQEGYDVAAPHITHSNARSPNTRHKDSAAMSSTLEYAELQLGNNPVGPAVPSAATVTYASIQT